jgi:hypothetical protein
MEPVHLRLAEIGLHVAGRYGFALAGGYAVQAHGILHRPSEDIDLFTAWESVVPTSPPRSRQSLPPTLSTATPSRLPSSSRLSRGSR